MKKEISTAFYKKLRSYYLTYEKYFIFHEIILCESLILPEILGFPKKVVKLLDIGCGDGSTTEFILRDVKDKKFVIDAIDPVPEYVKAYRKRFRNANVSVTEWEKFQTKKKYDIVIAINSLYGVPVEYRFYKKFLDILEPGGMALLLLLSENSTIVKYAKEYWKNVHNTEYVRKYFEKILEKVKDWFPEVEVSIAMKRGGIKIPYEDILKITGFFLYCSKEEVIKLLEKGKIGCLPDFSDFLMTYGMMVLRKM